MKDDVKHSRRYDSTRRQEVAEETSRLIMSAARQLFLERGYLSTTMPTIAKQAGVAVDTIYASCGRKPEILRALIERAISGEDVPVAALQRAYVREMQAEPDARRKLIRYARATTEIQARLAPLVRVLKEAAPTDPALAGLWATISQRRASNMRLLVADLETTGRLREDVTCNEAADVIWATNSPEFFMLMVEERGWSPDRFERWLAQSWIRLLLTDNANSSHISVHQKMGSEVDTPG